MDTKSDLKDSPRSVDIFPESIHLRSRMKGVTPPTAYVAPQKVKASHDPSIFGWPIQFRNTAMRFSPTSPPIPPPRRSYPPIFSRSTTPESRIPIGRYNSPGRGPPSPSTSYTNTTPVEDVMTIQHELDGDIDYFVVHTAEIDNQQDKINSAADQTSRSSYMETATRSQLSQHQLQIDHLQEKLKDLESQLMDTHTYSHTHRREQMSRPYSSADLLYHQHLSLQYKEQEINQLHDRLGRARSSLDICQQHFDQDLGRLRVEVKHKKDELGTLKCRVSELESECLMWRDKASVMEHSLRNAPIPTVLDGSQHRIQELQNDNSRLRETIDSMSKICHRLKKMAVNNNRRVGNGRSQVLETAVRKLYSELEWLQIQNGALSTSLEMKESEVNQLKENCGPNTTRSSIVPYPSKHLEVGEIESLKSCQFIVDCLNDTLKTLVEGESPDINKLLAIKSPSLQSLKNTTEIAQIGMPSNPTEEIKSLENSLQQLQQHISKYYAVQVAENSQCNVQ